MAKKLGIQTKGTGRAALQGGGVPPIAGAGGMAPVGGAARRDMRSGYYPSDMGMRGGPMYNKGGRVGLRDRGFKKGGRVGLKHAGPVGKLMGADKGWERHDKMAAEAAHDMAKKGKKQKSFFSDTGKSHGKGHRILDTERNRKRWKKHIKKAKAKKK
jgi:hypothetical protein